MAITWLYHIKKKYNGRCDGCYTTSICRYVVRRNVVVYIITITGAIVATQLIIGGQRGDMKSNENQCNDEYTKFAARRKCHKQD